MRSLRSHRFVSAVFAVAALAACAGTNGSNVAPILQSGIKITTAPNAPAKRGKARIVIHIPLKMNASRHPEYVSPSTRSMTVEDSGQATQTFNLTPSSPGCSMSSSDIVCSETFFLPAGLQTLKIALYDQQKGGGKALSTGATTVKIVTGKVKTISVALDGVVARATVHLGGGASASVPAGIPTTLPLTVSAYDAKGNLIIRPGGYASPISLKSTGATGLTTLSASEADSPGASVLLKYNGDAISSTATVTITPSINRTAQSAGAATLSITTGAPAATPTSLSFSSAATQTFAVQESGYNGALTATSSNATIAAINPSSGSGPAATFTVTPIGGGTCTMTVTDASGRSARVSVSVDGGSIIINRANPTSSQREGK